MRFFAAVAFVLLTAALAVTPAEVPMALGQVDAEATPTVAATVTSGGMATATVMPMVTGTTTATPLITPGSTAPTVTAVSPAEAQFGNEVTVSVNGSNFSPGAVVYIDERPLETTFANSTSLTARVPAGLAAGPYRVLVTVPGRPPSLPLDQGLVVRNLSSVLYSPVAVKRSEDNSTTIYAQNISSVPTTVYAVYYDAQGNSSQQWNQSQVLASGASAVFDQATHAALPMGFDGSVVLQSAQPITGILNRVNYSSAPALADGQIMAASQVNASGGSFPLPSSSQASQSATIPVAFGGYNGYTTTVSIQNTGPMAATYIVTLYPERSSSPIASIPRVIPPLTSARVRLDGTNGVPVSFVGTAVVSSQSGMLVAASETIHADTRVLLSYAGFATGSTLTNAPLLFKNYNDWVSGALVVNVSDAPVTVNATIYPRDGAVSFGPPPRTLAPFESFVYYLPSITDVPDGFVGSGVFNSSGPIALVVQELNSTRGNGMAYNGFPGGNTNISIPAIFHHYNGWDSGIQVQNLGSTEAVVNVRYYLAGGGSAGADAEVVPAGGSKTFYQPDNPSLPMGSLGSAVVSSTTGQPIVAIINEVNYERSGDASMAYEGINY